MSTDLFLINRALGIQSSDRTSVDLVVDRGDLRLVSGRDNLAQSIINRLLTRKGELTGLGHASYGSRLHELVGEPNSRRTRILAELYIRESLAMESRIKEVASVTIQPPSRADNRDVLAVQIVIRPTDGGTPMTVATTVNLGS